MKIDKDIVDEFTPVALILIGIALLMVGSFTYTSEDHCSHIQEGDIVVDNWNGNEYRVIKIHGNEKFKAQTKESTFLIMGCEMVSVKEEANAN